jgi:drug/metabolite transporter (DMT)-like permease
MFMRPSGYTLIFMTALISGFAIFVNKFGIQGFNPFLYTGIKNALVAVALFSVIIAFYWKKELVKLDRKDWRDLFIIGTVGGSVPFLLFFYGLSITTAIEAAFVHKLMFLFVAVLAFIFLKERLTKKQIAASAGLLLGLFFLIGLPSTVDEGVLLILAATIFWSIENTFAKHVLKRLSGTMVAFGRMFFGSIIILAYLGITGELFLVSAFTVEHWIWTFISVAFLFAYVMTWYNGLKTVKVSEATAILILGSAVTAFLELSGLTPEKFLGGLIIVLSILFLVLASTGSAAMIKKLVLLKKEALYAIKRN